MNTAADNHLILILIMFRLSRSYSSMTEDNYYFGSKLHVELILTSLLPSLLTLSINKFFYLTLFEIVAGCGCTVWYLIVCLSSGDEAV